MLVQHGAGTTEGSDECNVETKAETRLSTYGRSAAYSSLQPDARVFKTSVDYDSLTSQTRTRLRNSLEKKDYGGGIFNVLGPKAQKQAR